MTNSEHPARRWYDNDPILSKAMKTLQEAEDKIQIQIALNLIKILLEHKLECENLDPVELLEKEAYNAQFYEDKHSRWYDLNETIRAAILMLETCPVSVQKTIAKDLANLVTKVMQENTQEDA